MSVIITTDSPSDIPESIINKYNVGVIPLHVRLGDDEFFDGNGISISDIYKAYDEKKILPSTSAVSIAEYEDFFKKYTDNGDSVVHIAFSSGISSTYQNACIARDEIGKDIYIVDSKALSLSITLLVCKACEMRNNGLSSKAIYENIEAMVPKLSTTFVISSLEFLYKGGRCSALSAFGANALGLKPCIEMQDGKMVVIKKYRGKLFNANTQYIDDMLSQGPVDGEYCFIAHTGMDDDYLEKLAHHIKKKSMFKNIITSPCGTVVTAHGGRNTMGIFFLKK